MAELSVTVEQALPRLADEAIARVEKEMGRKMSATKKGPVVWHGTEREAAELAETGHRYCTCEVEPTSGVVVNVCPVHEAMFRDQHFVDELLFLRSIRGRLLREEWHTDR
jgi:hypothetical protein